MIFEIRLDEMIEIQIEADNEEEACQEAWERLKEFVKPDDFIVWPTEGEDTLVD